MSFICLFLHFSVSLLQVLQCTLSFLCCNPNLCRVYGKMFHVCICMSASDSYRHSLGCCWLGASLMETKQQKESWTLKFFIALQTVSCSCSLVFPTTSCGAVWTRIVTHSIWRKELRIKQLKLVKVAWQGTCVLFWESDLWFLNSASLRWCLRFSVLTDTT